MSNMTFGRCNPSLKSAGCASGQQTDSSGDRIRCNTTSRSASLCYGSVISRQTGDGRQQTADSHAYYVPAAGVVSPFPGPHVDPGYLPTQDPRPSTLDRPRRRLGRRPFAFPSALAFNTPNIQFAAQPILACSPARCCKDSAARLQPATHPPQWQWRPVGVIVVTLASTTLHSHPAMPTRCGAPPIGR